MTETVRITGGTVYTGRMRLEAGEVVISGGSVLDVLAAGAKRPVSRGERVIDATGCIVAPGFIDVHVHGGGGGDTSQRDAEAISRMALAHARFGTTSMLPTIYPAPWPEMIGAIDAVVEATRRRPQGARILGINMEGPFLNPSRCGALKPECLIAPSEEALARLAAASGDSIRMITIAPELPGAIGVIKACRRRNIRTAVGHSEASYEETILGINAGINHVTHVFNAMRRAHHRDPGVMGTVMINDEITAELICDFYHVHPAMVVLLLKVKPSDKIALVTDALAMTGLEGKEFEADGRTVVIEGGLPKLPDGTIAGSILTMNQAVKNVVSTGLVPLEDALRMASLVPAKVLGIEHAKGTLLPSSDADVVIMDDSLNVKLTMVEGQIVYRAPGF